VKYPSARPNFNGQDLAMWMGTIELTANDWRPYWDRLLQFDGLVFTCVGDEEGVELSDQELTVDSFPSDEWPLLVWRLAPRHGKGVGVAHPGTCQWAKPVSLNAAIFMRPFFEARPCGLLPGVDLIQQIGVTVEQHEEFHQRKWWLGLAVLVACRWSSASFWRTRAMKTGSTMGSLAVR
jgi:hypothetical protein